LKGENVTSMTLEELNEAENSHSEILLRIKKQKETLEKCVVCGKQKRTVVFGCGHLCVCGTCGESLTHCPVCNDQIAQKITLSNFASNLKVPV